MNVHTEYINGAKYEWKPGNIALPQTANISSAFPASPNYFECLEDYDEPLTVEPTSSRTDDSQPPAEATKSQAKRVSEKATKKKVEFASEVVTEVRTRPRFENEKELSQPKEEEIQNRRAAKCCRHLLDIQLKSMFTEKRPPPQRQKIRPSQAQRVTPAQYKKETTLALPSTTS